MKPSRRQAPFFLILLALLILTGCQRSANNGAGGANTLSDTPANRLAYSFIADTEAPPGASPTEETRLKPIQDDFDTRRKDDRLLRTVVSPDGQRALAVYDTGETQEGEFRIDMYAADGRFLRNLTPPELSGTFSASVSWSPDGNTVAFIGRKSLTPAPPPEMLPETPPVAPVPAPSVAPIFALVPVFDTEQVYVCNRDGFDLKPLTTRNGLIYFYLNWSPDSHAIVALACRENEWEERERTSRQPAGRPRLIELDGRERLLDDGLTEAAPVWSPDSSKVATAFETDLKIYDTLLAAPTQAVIPLREPLVAASVVYDEKNLQSKGKQSDGEAAKDGAASASAASAAPVSFNPIVRLAWPEDKALFVQTAYVRLYANEPVNNFQRWHRVNLSIQATRAASQSLKTRARRA
jgi:hypothetical protein